ncbi:hypothetical protein QUB80_21325 [Chlorogloeopsis sp. ULAP01]|uniref:hypothetical protein n=1 Tax=Chlorogloeopsis sp. ULAP01 TaxID=3056483 RepID=UPI0025AB3AA4|nr:hypothetical protein [Chlorogloeopsis sp. ULAP01]MDM9383236.1 hypothetical protein [Chlorogloeopsis sp. ULAP01]
MQEKTQARFCNSSRKHYIFFDEQLRQKIEAQIYMAEGFTEFLVDFLPDESLGYGP